MGDFVILLRLNEVDLNLINEYTNYKNCLNLKMKCFLKECSFNIVNLPNKIYFNVNNFYYENNTKYVDTKMRTAMKHYLLQMNSDYFDYINNKKISINSENLGLFSSIISLRVFTSSSNIIVQNLINKNEEHFNTLFIWDKKILGYIGFQYLSPTSWNMFESSWKEIKNVTKYEKILYYDKCFFFELKKNINVIAKEIWEKKIYSLDYKSYEDVLFYIDDVINTCSKMHYNFKNSNNLKYESSLNLFNFVHDINIKKVNDAFEIGCNVIAVNRYNSNFVQKDFKNLDTFIEKLELLKNQELIEKYNEINFKKSINKINENNFNLFFFLNLLKKKNKLNILDSELVFDCFNDIFNNCKNKDLNLYLIEFSTISNLVYINKFLENQDLIFYYIIPKKDNINNKNIIFFCQKEKIININSKKFSLYTEKNLILKFLSENIKWKKINYYSHIFFWNKNQQNLVSSYLDLVSGGIIDFLPDNWGGF